MQVNHTYRRAAALVAGLGLAVSGLGVAQAATTTTQIRQADLIGDTRAFGTASFEFLADGLAISVPSGDAGVAFARGVWRAGYPLSEVTTMSSDWVGTVGQPAIRLDIDLDADGKPDGQLVSEPDFYGTQDVWLNRDIGDYAGLTPTLPEGTFADAAPCNGGEAADGVTDPCGSSGDQFHGTLANWNAKLQAATGKTPVVFSAGFASSGTEQGGVLRSATVGSRVYTFTNTAAPTPTPTPAPTTTPPAKAPAAVTVKSTKQTVKPGKKVRFAGTVAPVGPGAKLQVQKKRKGGGWVTKQTIILPTTGAYDTRVRVGKKLGKVKLRAVLPETTTTQAFVARTVTITVKRP